MKPELSSHAEFELLAPVNGVLAVRMRGDWIGYADAIAPYPAPQAVLAALIFLFLAMVVDKICSRALVRLLARTDTATGNRIIELLHRPVYVTVMLIGLVFASNRLSLSEPVNNILYGVVGTILVLVWSVTIHRLSGVVFTAMVRNDRRYSFAHPATAPVFRNAIAVLLFAVGVYGLLVTWEVNVTALLASAGIVGLALSFAAQDTLGNLFAGVSILADRPYEIGDYVVLDSGERGEVTHIGLRSTRLITRDDVGVTIPNGVIARAKIVNEAASPRRQFRIRINVGVAYGTNIRQLIKVLIKIAQEHEEISSTPEPRARFRSFGDFSLKFELLCWIERPADRGRISHELNCEIYETFEELGITIPFPQRDINVRGALA
jgi:MscS family membrane protein